jgi:hypothetical protein
MKGLTKGLFVFMIILISLSYLMTRADISIIDTRKDAYVSMIRAASQVATRELINTMDINFLYDGDRREAQDIPVDMNALLVFNRTLDRILTSQSDNRLQNVSRMSIVMTGFVTYDHIVGVVYPGGTLTDDEFLFVGTHLLPADYSIHVEAPILNTPTASVVNNKIWQFTLGNVVRIRDVGGTTFVEWYLQEVGSQSWIRHITTRGTDLPDTEDVFNVNITTFLRGIGFATGKELSEFVVMTKIDEYLNNYSGASFNPIARNTGASTLVNLGKTDVSSDRGAFTSRSSVISGPGMFAVVDVFTGTTGNETLFERIASFGGSELVSRDISRWGF